MNQSIKSRLAPSPSGLLHAGNAYNFLITYREVVLKRKGSLALRIDDSDSTRVKDEFIQDTFDTLDWLEIPVSSGPKDLQDFKSNYSQSLKTVHYRKFLNGLAETYVCECSRSYLKENHCPCSGYQLNYQPGRGAIKLKVSDPAVKEKLGDFVLWRKDDLPAYQLTSLVDDIDMNINFVVRGEDLKASTMGQLYLAKRLELDQFSKIEFMHHKLITTGKKEKISKSNENSPYTLRALRHEGKTREDLIKLLGFKSLEDFFSL